MFALWYSWIRTGMLIPTNPWSGGQLWEISLKHAAVYQTFLSYHSSVKEINTALSKGLQIHKWLQTSWIQCCPTACQVYFDAGISEYGLIFKRGTKVASLLKEPAQITAMEIISCTSPALLLSSYTPSQNSPEVAQKKLKFPACVALSDTCRTVLTVGRKIPFTFLLCSEEAVSHSSPILAWNVVVPVAGGRQWQAPVVFPG